MKSYERNEDDSDEFTDEGEELIDDSLTPRIKALSADQEEDTYMNSAREQKARISEIRKAQAAATNIQHAWRRYKQALHSSNVNV